MSSSGDTTQSRAPTAPAHPGDQASAERRRRRIWLLGGALVLAALGAAAYGYQWLHQPRLPPGFASGNGRVEATEYDIATKRAGRVVEVRVREGDLVQKGQVLAQMDIEELTAQRREAEAQLQRTREAHATAKAVVVERESERKLAQIEHRRAQKLVEEDAAPIQRLDRDRTRHETAQAAVHAAQEQLNETQSAIAAAEANLQRVRTLLDETTLVSPIRGRVIYRLAEPGEVLPAGGKVVTILDLADVYMTVFIPTEQAGRIGFGAEARMELDAFPDLVLPASVSFVSPEAQFTPKEVETRTEREKLMFRIKVKIDQALLEQHLEQVKTGIPGVSYIRLADGGEWPDHLAVRLPPSETVAPAARLRGVTHRYGKTLALDGVDLEIPAGGMAGLIGPDGVGKSTLLGLVTGARAIQTGSVEVLGGDIGERTFRSQVADRIAYMPQGLGKNLYPTLSVFENVDFFGRLFGHARAEREAKIDELLAATGLARFRERPAGKLSGGMKQKLSLCCALIHDPELLVLDEPTTGVDPLSRRQFWELVDRIRERRPGMTVVVSTAYMEEAEVFGWLAAMNAGRVLATGTPAELKERTATRDLDAAFIALLPEEARRGHRELHVPPRKSTGGEPVIEAEGLTRRFGDFVAVDHVNFRIERGEIFGFLGSNGCGKTTTMKMLTGLLPVTEGRARLFGRDVEAREGDVRKQIGYMTQAFSLYGELSVRQNLVLHAQLFELPRDRIGPRVDELLERFDLREQADQLAEALPLGIRQRLSLAVAIVHSPEMLILDEPTSGVDPVARDGFWELLIDLSRNQGVTIFVSTHFMNEGERCDRISLMHAGRVLVSDAPAEIVRARGAASLQEAFISHLEEAAGKTDDAAAPEAKASARAHAPRRAFSPARLFAYARREHLELLRDPVRLAFAVGGALILMLIFGYGLNMDVEDVRFAVLDQDGSRESRDYARAYQGSHYFVERPPIADGAELERRLRSGELSVAIGIPPDFGRDLRAGRTVEVGVASDGAMPYRGETIRGYVNSVHLDHLRDLARREGVAIPALAELELRYRYNQGFVSIVAMVPAVIPLLLVMLPAMLTALGVVREKELGSITNLYVTPVTRFEFLLGKQLPYVVLAMVSYLSLVALAVFVFHVPVKGSFLGLTLGALLYVAATTAMGLVFSSFTNTQVAAVTSAAILTMVPTISFSGLTRPVSSLEGPGAFIGQIFPASYFITLCRGAFSKGLAFHELLPQMLAIGAFVPVYVLLSLALLRKQGR